MLSNLNKGTKAKIIEITGGNQLVKRRLLDLGVTEGSEICIKCKMPFGGPIMIESCGQCVGIRRLEASYIKVAER